PDDGPGSADPWGAEAFLEGIDHGAYGTRPGQLRDGLTLLSEADQVWVSPGLPFLVPLVAGLVIALVYGDILFVVLRLVGLV
ncbi:MAG: A24 family peptidase C-terminal domain-containing protein, partial [Halobacteriales archaeon]|nr:A24 family peptidase C-terminal domain-containing protein [Halobacteriales archaeon]